MRRRPAPELLSKWTASELPDPLVPGLGLVRLHPSCSVAAVACSHNLIPEPPWALV